MLLQIGQHAFVGVGAYAFYGFAVFAGLDPYLALLLAGLTALVFAVPVMLVMFFGMIEFSSGVAVDRKVTLPALSVSAIRCVGR